MFGNIGCSIFLFNYTKRESGDDSAPGRRRRGKFGSRGKAEALNKNPVDLKPILKEHGDQTPNGPKLGVVSPDSGFLKGD